MYRIAILFILIGFAIKYAKMYFLIAGYNTMPKAEKAKINIEALGRFLGNVLFTMGAIVLVADLLIEYFDTPEAGLYIQLPVIVIGVLWIIVRSNSKKYRYER